MAERRFLDFLDRIDGGGMGRSGDTFEGGGLLSLLGNLFASPYGSQNPDRRARRDAFYAGQMGEPMAASGFNPPAVRTGGEMATSPFERFGGQPPATYQPQAPTPTTPALTYGPPARALVGPNLREAMGLAPEGTGQAPSPARANYAPTREKQADMFLASLQARYGSSKANAIAKAPFALDLFKQYVNNNYQLPQGY